MQEARKKLVSIRNFAVAPFSDLVRELHRRIPKVANLRKSTHVNGDNEVKNENASRLFGRVNHVSFRINLGPFSPLCFAHSRLEERGIMMRKIDCPPKKCERREIFKLGIFMRPQEDRPEWGGRNMVHNDLVF